MSSTPSVARGVLMLLNGTATNAADIKRRVDAKAREVKAEIRRANGRASSFLQRWVFRNFAEEGGLVGGWKPFARGGRWNPKTGEIDTSAVLLQDTGQMRSSFLPFATDSQAGVGSEMPRALKHHEGAPEARLPSRRLLPEPEEVEKDLVEIYGYVPKAVVRGKV